MPLGQPGEIAIKGPQVMAGYWQRPDETAKVMTADGYFKSGDIGMVDERGYFKIVDRKKDMMLVSGFNVYPNEVEDVVARLPGVLECAVVGVPDDKTGEAVKLVIVQEGPGPHRGAGARLLQGATSPATSAPGDRVPHRTCPRRRSARSCAERCATRGQPLQAPSRSSIPSTSASRAGGSTTSAPARWPPSAPARTDSRSAQLQLRQNLKFMP